MEKQGAMKKADMVIVISGSSIEQVNGEYCRDPARPEIFLKQTHDRWERQNHNYYRIIEYVAIFQDKAEDGKNYWCIKAFQRITDVRNAFDPSLPKTINTELFYIAPATNDDCPPLRDWRAMPGVKGRVPSIQISSKKVVVRSKQDLESATRNYFREYFFRNSLDGRNISNHEIMDHISYTMTGKRNPLTKKVPERKASWRNVISDLLVDTEKNQQPLKQFMQKQSDGANVRWAWHGTNSNAVKSIASKNFDPAFCKRQVHGKGHYFSPDPHFALKYAPATTGEDGQQYHCLLLCQVLLGHSTASRSNHGDSCSHADFCYVVPDEAQIWPVYVVVVRC